MRVPSLHVKRPHLNDPRDHLGPKAKKTVTMLSNSPPRPPFLTRGIPNSKLCPPGFPGSPWQPAPPGEDARVHRRLGSEGVDALSTGGGEGRPQGPPPRESDPRVPARASLALAVPDARPAHATTPPAPASKVPAPPPRAPGPGAPAGLGGRQPAALSPRRCLLEADPDPQPPSREQPSPLPGGPRPHPPPARPQACRARPATTLRHSPPLPRRRRRRLRPS